MSPKQVESSIVQGSLILHHYYEHHIESGLYAEGPLPKEPEIFLNQVIITLQGCRRDPVSGILDPAALLSSMDCITRYLVKNYKVVNHALSPK